MQQLFSSLIDYMIQWMNFLYTHKIHLIELDYQ